MSENEIAKFVLDSAFTVHTKLGPGLLESVYEVVLAHELRKSGASVERQKAMPTFRMASDSTKPFVRIWWWAKKS